MDLASLLIARSRRHFVWEFPGPLSVKSVMDGTVRWLVNGRALAVSPGQYLVLNDGQPYSLDIDEPSPVETFCVFFRRGVVEQAALPLTAILDDPEAKAGLTFPACVQNEPNSLTPLLGRVRSATLAGRDPEPHVASLIEALAGLQRLPSIRWSTRDELLKRVLAARDYLEACPREIVTLEKAARVACLSVFHFHRAFSAVFRESPRAYAQRRRLERACADLIGSKRSMTRVALEHGFGSAAALSTAVRKQFGESPSQIRKIGEIPSRRLS